MEGTSEKDAATVDPRGKGRKAAETDEEVDPNSPSGRLKALLEAQDMGQTELAERLTGERGKYLLVHRWIKGRGFNEENQRWVTEELGLPKDYFSDPDLAEVREAHRLRVWEKFLTSEWALNMTEQERRILAAIRFTEDIVPDVMTYAGMLVGLKHRTPPDQIARALEETKKLVDSAKKKGRKVLRR